MSQNKKEEAASGGAAGAVAALQGYTRGSGRGKLSALDQVVLESLRSPVMRRDLEDQLITALEGNLSPCAVEYACGKLALMGSGAAVPVLRKLLNEPETVEAALAALRSIPDEAAARALREQLTHGERPSQLGAIHAVGFRRDAESVPVLAKLLSSGDEARRAAAARALGQIGTPKAGRALREAANAKPGLNPDALLTCAELLRKEQHPAEARAIYSMLAGAVEPHVKLAAERGLGAFAKKL